MANATEYRASVETLGNKGFTGMLATLRTTIARRKIYASTMNELLELTDRELNDMGLGRGDLKRIAMEAANEQLA